MGSVPLTPELLELIAERFKALAEPARLKILNSLRDGEKSVSQLMEATGLGQANVSKHLQLLHGLGFVDRRKEGLYVHYSLASRCIDGTHPVVRSYWQLMERRTAWLPT